MPFGLPKAIASEEVAQPVECGADVVVVDLPVDDVEDEALVVVVGETRVVVVVAVDDELPQAPEREGRPPPRPVRGSFGPPGTGVPSSRPLPASFLWPSPTLLATGTFARRRISSSGPTHQSR